MIFLLVNNEDILKVLGKNIKKIRKEKGYTQDYVAEQINVSTDLLRSIENGRNIGSITTLLNICNFLQVSPNTLFAELLDFKEETIRFIFVKSNKSAIQRRQKYFERNNNSYR